MRDSEQEGRLRSTMGQRRVVAGEDLEILEDEPDALTRTHRRFGGIDTGAIVGGMLAALGTAVLLGGLAAAAGSVGYQLDVERDSTALSIGGFIAGMVVLIASFAIGGWVAGRIARYDGARNGALTAVLFLIVSLVLGAAGTIIGEQYDVFGNVAVPQFFAESSASATALSIGSVALACLVMLIAGWLGGIAGGRYHREADEFLTGEGRGRPLMDPSVDPDQRMAEAEDMRELSREIREREMLRQAAEAARQRGQMFRPRSEMVQRAEQSDESRSPNLTRAERSMLRERQEGSAVASEDAAMARSDDSAETVARESFTSARFRRTY